MSKKGGLFNGLRGLFERELSKDYIAFEFIQTEIRRICNDPDMTMRQCLGWFWSRPGRHK